MNSGAYTMKSIYLKVENMIFLTQWTVQIDIFVEKMLLYNKFVKSIFTIFSIKKMQDFFIKNNFFVLFAIVTIILFKFYEIWWVYKSNNCLQMVIVLISNRIREIHIMVNRLRFVFFQFCFEILGWELTLIDKLKSSLT